MFQSLREHLDSAGWNGAFAQALFHPAKNVGDAVGTVEQLDAFDVKRREPENGLAKPKVVPDQEKSRTVGFGIGCQVRPEAWPCRHPRHFLGAGVVVEANCCPGDPEKSLMAVPSGIFQRRISPL